MDKMSHWGARHDGALPTWPPGFRRSACRAYCRPSPTWAQPAMPVRARCFRS